MSSCCILCLSDFSKRKLFKKELVFKLAIIVVKWARISGMLEGGTGSLKQSRYI